MKEALLRMRVFIGLHIPVLIASLTVIALNEKLDLHLWFNQFHNSFFDFFFRFATQLAEGWFIGIVVFLALLHRVRLGVAGLAGIALSGITTQMLKRLVFGDHFRPIKLFDGLADLHLIEGVTMHSAHSFPSGHATAAFALFLFGAYAFKKKWVQLVCYGFALITAYSRVYLSQHFFEDIVVGSAIGILVCFGLVSLIDSFQWGERGLIQTLGIRSSGK